jgi:RNA polymerase sigma-70 factor (ECF subfamily)
MTSASDEDLVRASLAGDEFAFGALVRKHQRVAYMTALGVTGRPEDAEDVAQEAFLVALERLEDCRDPARFLGWLLTIVRNRGRNYLRREGLRRGEVIPPHLASGEPGPERDLDRSRLTASLEEALGELNEVRRQVVLLHDLEGWKHREIAETLDIPEGTVRSHLHFARKALREALEGMGETPRELDR